MTIDEQLKDIDLPIERLMKVKHGEHEFTLVFDYEAIKRAEDTLSFELMDMQQWPKLKIEQIATIMWCGLATNHPETSLADVRKMVNGRNKLVLKAAMFDQFFPGLIQSIADQKAKSDSPNVQAPADEAKA